MSIADLLRKAMQAVGLDANAGERKRFAELAWIDPVRLEAALVGPLVLDPSELDAVARIIGLRYREFLAGDEPRMSGLLRTTHDFVVSSDELVASNAIRALGELQRAVADHAELEALLGLSKVELPRVTWPMTDPKKAHPAELAAKVVRQALGLGVADPIESMRRLLEEKLRIPIFWVQPFAERQDSLDRDIEGASTVVPRPALMVNLLDGGRAWWRTRMVLAHELAHVVFHRQLMPTFFSPRLPDARALDESIGSRAARSRWTMFEQFQDLEVDADAFAACFLAPAAGVREAVAKLDPTSEDAIYQVGRRFGLGQTVAINRLQDVFEIPASNRREMEQLRVSYFRDGHPDTVETSRIGLRTGALKDLVGRALEAGLIDDAQPWNYLDLPLTEALPFEGLPTKLTAPLVSIEDAMRRRALKLLAGMDANHFPDRVEAHGPDFIVHVVASGDWTPAGYLVMTRAGSLLEEHLLPLGTA